MSNHIGTLTVPVHINGTQVTTVLNGETLPLGTLDKEPANSQEVEAVRGEILHHLSNVDSSLDFNVTMTVGHS